jgi:hypothetical protein
MDLTQQQVPKWIKYTYTLFIAVMVPAYYRHFGPTNFLWFSDIALLIMFIEVWLCTGILTSMMAVGALLFELGWNGMFTYQIIVGNTNPNFICNILTPGFPILFRILPLFHIFLPIIIIYMLKKLGYDKRAIWYQSIFGILVLCIAHMATTKPQNIDWTYAFNNSPYTNLPQPWNFIIVILLFMLFYQFSHFLLSKYCKKTKEKQVFDVSVGVP